MSIEDKIARFDWSRIQTYVGHAEMVPDTVRGLVAATDEKEAARLGQWIEHVLLSVAGPCEACTAREINAPPEQVLSHAMKSGVSLAEDVAATPQGQPLRGAFRRDRLAHAARLGDSDIEITIDAIIGPTVLSSMEPAGCSQPGSPPEGSPPSMGSPRQAQYLR